MPVLMYEVDVQDEYTAGEMQADVELDSGNLPQAVCNWLQNEHDKCAADSELYVDQSGQRDGEWLIVILDRCQDGGSMIVTCKPK